MRRACTGRAAWRQALLPVLPALVAGCALAAWAPVSVRPGQTRAEVLQAMGPPTAVHRLGEGERLEYSHMPAGKQTYMVDLDAAGRVVGWEQVLDEAHFARVVPGLHREEVLRLIGPPTWRGSYHLPRPGITWFYRYEAVPRCQVFEVAFDAETGQVISGDYPADPGCPGEWL